MKKLMLVAVFLLAAGSLFAGDGKSCDRSAKAVSLAGVVAFEDGTDGERVRVLRVANSDTVYTICDESTVDLATFDGAKVEVTGKVVTCDEGKELVITKAKRI